MPSGPSTASSVDAETALRAFFTFLAFVVLFVLARFALLDFFDPLFALTFEALADFVFFFADFATFFAFAFFFLAIVRTPFRQSQEISCPVSNETALLCTRQ
jgi:hypothetical protein